MRQRATLTSATCFHTYLRLGHAKRILGGEARGVAGLSPARPGGNRSMRHSWHAALATFAIACGILCFFLILSDPVPEPAAPVAADVPAAAPIEPTPVVDDSLPVATTDPWHKPAVPPAPPLTPEAAPVTPAPATPPTRTTAPVTPRTPPAPTTVAVTTPAPAISTLLPPDHPAVTYTLNPASSWLFVIVRYDRSSAIKGHDHAVRATTFTGSVTWDADDPSACAVHIEFPATALQVDTPGLRAKAGLEGESDAKDHAKIEQNLLGAAQLDAARFATLHYTSTKCEATAIGAKVTGMLGMHGVEKAVTMSMSIEASDTAFRGKGTLKFEHEAFGFSPFTAALGMVRNDGTLELRVDVRGTPKG